MPKQDIVVVGGSSGSSAPLKQLVHGLPRDFPGSVFITTHIPSTHPSYLAQLLGRDSSIPVLAAMDGQPIEPGRAYVATQDRHLLLLGNSIRLGAGPRENMSRPSIDPMFRSAALSFGPRAVGVILSGLLNDGASGLHAIKAAGGTAVVQHPIDALAGEMPRAAIEAVQCDHIVNAGELPGLLAKLAASEAGPPLAGPESLVFEIEGAGGARRGAEKPRRLGGPLALTRPGFMGVPG